MKKQELIKHFEEMEYVSVSQMGKKAFIDMIEQLDEPQKPVVPQIIADYIKYAKENDWDLQDAMDSDFIASEEDRKLSDWFYKDKNMETFALAWINGYTVEKEKRYYVKLKAVDQYLVRNEDDNFLGFLQSRLKSKFTRKQLEQAELGWVFDCEGIEIEEVEG